MVDVFYAVGRGEGGRQRSVVVRHVLGHVCREGGIVVSALGVTLRTLHVREGDKDHQKDKASNRKDEDNLDNCEAFFRFCIHRIRFLSFILVFILAGAK